MSSNQTPNEEIVAASANVNDDVSDNDGGNFQLQTPNEEIVAASANVNDDVNDNDGGNFQLPLIHKAIFAHFYSKEVSRNSKFSWKTFLLKNPDLKQASAKYYHKNNNIIEILKGLKLKYGKIPFENHSDIEWVSKGSLISLYEIPYDILVEYAPDGDTTRKRCLSSLKGKSRKIAKKLGN